MIKRPLAMLIAFSLGLACATPGNYVSLVRQAIYDSAMRLENCARPCCEMTGGENGGAFGLWSDTQNTCTWHPNAMQLQACENWCRGETGLAR